MNRPITKRDLTIVGSLCAFLVVVMIGVIVTATRSTSEATVSSDGRGGGLPSDSSRASRPSQTNRNWLRDAESSDYSVIEKRAVLGASLDARRSARVTTLPASPSVAPLPSLPPFPVRTDAAARVEGPSQDRISVVGMVRINGRTEAVVEDLSKGETKFVPIGGEAFGYRIVRLGSNDAVLSKGGKQYPVALGENKPDPKPAPPARSASSVEGNANPAARFGVTVGGGGGDLRVRGIGGGGGFGDFFRNMSDEDRAQFREKIQNMSPEERREFFRSQFEQLRSQQPVSEAPAGQ